MATADRIRNHLMPARRGRGMAVDALLLDLPDVSESTVRRTLKAMVADGRVIAGRDDGMAVYWDGDAQ